MTIKHIAYVTTAGSNLYTSFYAPQTGAYTGGGEMRHRPPVHAPTINHI